MTSTQIYNYWKENVTDAALAADIAAATEDTLKRYFTSPLEFGTAGLRGIMTAGPGAMNIHTVAQATRGLAEYILKSGEKNPSVVIAHDTRNNSRLFAEISASTLASAGIKALLFDGARPTPELSFAVRELGCTAGINITASHNPKEYNGYKVYYSDGAQIGEAQADAISAEIQAIDCFSVNVGDFDSLVASGMISTVPTEFDAKYIDRVLREQVRGDIDRSLSIVYTPLHGAGASVVPTLLAKAGFTGVKLVPEQLIGDGNFPTASKPNPEFAEAFELGIKLANECGATIVVANDPDADRAGAAVKTADGSFRVLSGNEIGGLLLEYILSSLRDENKMPNNAFAVKSIVSTRLTDRICREYGIALRNTPTGFKYIGEQIEKSKSTGDSFIFGFEESNGYLVGDYARDKDGPLAIMLLCEAAAYYGAKGMTLVDALEDVYRRYGVFREFTLNIVETGADAKAIIDGKLVKFRAAPPTEVAGKAVKVVDYLDDGSPIGRVNMLSVVFEDACEIMVRPSGTEPKMKVYVHVNGENAEVATAKAAELKAAAEEMFN